jgi:hypothetical protein
VNPVKVGGPTGLYARDHDSRSEQLIWGTHLVAGLGSQPELTCPAIAQRRRKRPSRAGSRSIGVACSDLLDDKILISQSRKMEPVKTAPIIRPLRVIKKRRAVGADEGVERIG